MSLVPGLTIRAYNTVMVGGQSVRQVYFTTTANHDEQRKGKSCTVPMVPRDAQIPRMTVSHAAALMDVENQFPNALKPFLKIQESRNQRLK